LHYLLNFDRKHVLLVFILISLIFTRNSFSIERYYGPSEKTPYSFLGLSLSDNLNDSQEFFIALGYAGFGGGITYGYKHYKNKSSENSPYVSVSMTTGIYTDIYNSITGIYPSLGYSKVLSEKSRLNLGLGLVYDFNDNVIHFSPIFSLLIDTE